MLARLAEKFVEHILICLQSIITIKENFTSPCCPICLRLRALRRVEEDGEPSTKVCKERVPAFFKHVERNPA